MEIKFSGLVIAGGKSQRMGTNKALMIYDGERLIDRAIGILKPIAQEVILISNLRIDGIDIPQSVDTIKEIGPLGGLFTGLSKITNEYAFVIPCDVPLINTSVYQMLTKHIQGFDAVVPQLPDGSIEPLIAIYSKPILSEIKQQIELKNYKLTDLLKRIKVNFIQVNEMYLFKNLNTPNDLL